MRASDCRPLTGVPPCSGGVEGVPQDPGLASISYHSHPSSSGYPVPLVAGDPESRKALGELVMTGVCFSAEDRVLDWAFRLGETRSGWFMPEAVGLRGAPARMWNSRLGMNLHHTQYWQSRAVAAYVAARLGATIGGSLSTRPGATTAGLPSGRLELPSRELRHRPDSVLRELRERANVVIPVAA